MLRERTTAFTKYFGGRPLSTDFYPDFYPDYRRWGRKAAASTIMGMRYSKQSHSTKARGKTDSKDRSSFQSFIPAPFPDFPQLLGEHLSRKQDLLRIAPTTVHQ
jgi:hypothetical protein